MSIVYPGAIDSSTNLPSPSSTSITDNPDHAGLHDNINLALVALETKLGTGSLNQTPTSNNFLIGDGIGSSSWNKPVPTGDVVGTSDTQTLTNKTLTSPVINSPIITNASITTDTITGYSLSTTGTIYGLSITSGTIGTPGLANASVSPSKLGTGASAASVATSETTTSTTYTNLSTIGPSVTVTIGSNGIAIVSITAYLYNTIAAESHMSYAATGANTIAASDSIALINSGTGAIRQTMTYLVTGLSAGSTTFTAKYNVGGGVGTFRDRNISVIPL